MKNIFKNARSLPWAIFAGVMALVVFPGALKGNPADQFFLAINLALLAYWLLPPKD